MTETPVLDKNEAEALLGAINTRTCCVTPL
jgi:hypothetical protein